MLSILAASLSVTWMLWKHEQHNAVLDLRTQLDSELIGVGSRITQRMQISAQMLQGVQGLFAAASNVGHKEFRAYVEALQLGPDFSGIQGIGIALIVPHAQKSGHIAALRKQGFPEYAIRPMGERSVYAPVIQLEPFIGTNQRALGFDPYAISTRRGAMELSRDSGAATITGKIQLVLNTDTDSQPGFVMFLPIFKLGMPHDTVASRRASIIGWVNVPIRMNSFMASLYGELAAATDISIYDGVEMTDETLLYDSAGSHGKTGSTKVDAVEYIQVAGHTWTLAIRALPGFAARAGKDKSEFIVIAGIGLSLLLTLLTSNLVTSRERARIQARALRETKEHFETIFNASPDSVLITRLSDGIITEVNHAFTANTGYARDESIGHSTLDLDTWTNLDDRRRCISELREKGYTKDIEAQFRKKDGTLHTGIVSARAVALRGAEHAIWIIRDITARKRTEDALHQSEERLALILACANLGTWDWNLKTGSFVSNQHWADLRDLRLNEVQSHVSSWEKGIHPDDLSGLRQVLADHLDNRSQIFEAEYRIRTHSGGWIWVLDRGMVVGRDAEGNPLRIAGIEMDVTKRKHAEEAGQEALDRLLKIASRVPGVVYQYRLYPDGTHCFPFASEAIREIFRVAPEEVKADASRPFSLLHPDDYDGLISSIQDSARDLTPWRHEFRMRFDDGAVTWLFGNASPEREADGAILWHGFITDITERRRSEIELQLRGVALEAAANAMVITDRHGLIEWANAAFCALSGYTREEALGRNPRDLLKSGIETQEHYANLWRTINAGKVWHGEFVNRRKDGTYYHEYQTITPVRDEAGIISHFVAVKQDITERKLNEARMSALSRHLVELQEGARRRLAGELHDRTSPNLAAIGINLDVMAATLLSEGSPKLAARLDDTRALIEDTTASIREICADLRPPVLDYAGLLAALESYANQFSRRTGISVQVECAHPVVRLSSELESTLFRIAQEALTNCAKHSRATSIRVALDQTGRFIVLTVADNGIGFDPDMLRTAMHPGGLGTITMKELTEFSGGTFTLESSSGNGTRIRVEIDFSKGLT